MTGIKVAEVVGWQDGETPSVPEGLAVTPYAKDLANPRTVHTLPNGDVLVVQSRGPEGEPATRPKDVIRGWIMAYAHGFGGGEQKESNLVTLLRDTDRDGKVDERSDLLTGLDCPSGSRGSTTRSTSPRRTRSWHTPTSSARRRSRQSRAC